MCRPTGFVEREDRKNDDGNHGNHGRTPSALGNSTFLERVFWSWPYPLLKLGSTRPLSDADMPHVEEQDTSESLTAMLGALWEAEQTKEKPSLRNALFFLYVKSTMYIQTVLVVESAVHVLQALALGGLIRYFSGSKSASEGFLWASAVVGCSLYVLFAHHIYFFQTWRMGMQYKNACIGLIYKKCLRLRAGHDATGPAVNLATNDVERFFLGCIFLPYLLWGPLEAIAVLFVGVNLIGWSFSIGFVLLLLFVPLQYYLSMEFSSVRSKVASHTDKRVTLVSQAVHGCRLMKMSGWESSFASLISEARAKEIKQVHEANRLKAYNESLFFVCNVIIAAVIFTAEVKMGGTLNAADVFTVMTLVNIVQFTMTKFFSLGIMGVSEVLVSINRIQNFLQYPERKLRPEADGPTSDNPFAIDLDGVTCHWDDDLELPVAVRDVTLKVKPNTLHFVIGPVGSGKSALLQCILSELEPLKGTAKVNGSLAYAAQQPFIISGTIQENICFGRPFDAGFYKRVVASVGLNVDFVRLPQGDKTLIGDRGVNLSGGQKARVGLARAIYSRASVVLLDDVLSAVDAEVARKIFYKAVVGLLMKEGGATVVLVSHQHQFCAEGGSVNVLMVDGAVAHVGSYKDCISASEGKLSATMADDGKKGGVRSRLRTLSDPSDQADDADKDDELEADKAQAGAKESRETGKISGKTFWSYARAMGEGGLMTFWVVLMMMLGGQVMLILTLTELGEWGEQSEEDQQSDAQITKIWLFCAFTTLLSFFRTISAFHFCINAAKYLHDKMTKTILRAKISFFDTNPLGVILNRFSADVGTTDDMLVATLFDFCLCSFMSLGGVLTAAYALPIILATIPFLGFYFWKIRQFFIKSSREIKRVESITRSPVFSMISEALNGLTTLRAYPASINYFTESFKEKHDSNIRSFFAFIACTRWLGFRLDAICFVLLTSACYLAVVFNEYSSFYIDPAILGLAIMMLIQLAGLFQWSVRQSAEAENQLVSVERILEFSQLPTEGNLDEDPKVDVEAAGSDWPSAGEVIFEEVTARYRPELDPSLDGVSFKIKGGERVGVVGRTGSGKSTLLQVLFRLLDEIQGLISVDGVDVTKLSLHKFRRAMSVIPQTPTLFNISLRGNLDPFGEFNDVQIWEALECVQMAEAVRTLSGGLDFMLAEGGSNFSVGQQQLICLSRAILVKSKILIMDESAANVDSNTDKKLNAAVTTAFANSTIISIAHRLDSIIDYDKILVLGDGKVLEFGSPMELVKGGGVFLNMIEETGSETANELKRRALARHE